MIVSYPMYPPSDGRRNNIETGHSKYHATPGNSVNVPAHDVEILAANGWTMFATAPGPVIREAFRPKIYFHPAGVQ